jgi:3-oxoacyl-(acyl-carrier-protein) synthase
MELAITGLGVVSPFAIGAEAHRAALDAPEVAAARAFAGPIATLPEAELPGARVAEVRDFDAARHLGDKGLRNFDRLTKFLIVAAKQALEDAGLKRDGAWLARRPEEVGIISATAYGSLDAITELNLVAEREDPRYINPARFPNTVVNAAAGYVSIWEDLRAPNVTIVDGNCGALDAVLTAETHLAHARADVFLVGGGEVVSEPLYRALRKLALVAEGDAPWAPGEALGHGMRVGEGAAYVVVERPADAVARGARVRGRILGYGTAFTAPESEALIVHPSVDGVARAVRAAVRDAGLAPADIDAVVCAASGLERFDAAELVGLGRALHPDVLCASAKAYGGETFGAAGAFGLATGLAWLDGAPVAPVLCGRARGRLEHIVVTTVGFYGNVSAIVLGRATTPERHP